MMEEEPEKDSLVELRTYRSDGGESARGVGKGDE